MVCWLTNYIPDLIRKTAGGFKDKVISLFNTKTPNDYGKQIMHGRGKKTSKPKTQKQSEENIAKSIRNLFKLKKENEVIKDRIIRDIRTLFKQEEDHYLKPRNKYYIEYESNGDINKNQSVKEYLNKI